MTDIPIDIPPALAAALSTYEDAAFACGEWDEDSDESYGAVSDACYAARAALLAELAKLAQAPGEPERARLLVVCDGGLIRSLCAERPLPVDVFVVDLDVDNLDTGETGVARLPDPVVRGPVSEPARTYRQEFYAPDATSDGRPMAARHEIEVLPGVVRGYLDAATWLNDEPDVDNGSND